MTPVDFAEIESKIVWNGYNFVSFDLVGYFSNFGAVQSVMEHESKTVFSVRV